MLIQVVLSIHGGGKGCKFNHLSNKQMKKLLIGLVAITTFALATGFTTRMAAPAFSYCKHGQCAFTKPNGGQCKNCAQKGSVYCYSHNHQ